MSNLIAQWEEQSFIALIFPSKNTHWISCLDKIQKDYCRLALLISKYQEVLIITDSEKLPTAIQNKPNIKMKKALYNDTWARDILPISTRVKNKISLLNFIFNGWGEKYNFKLDNSLSKKIFNNIIDIDICLEGGAIDNNGDKFILLNKQSLISNRNKEPFEKIIKKLEKIFQAHILILENGSLQGDDTDSHIDTLARFVNKNTIVYLSCDDKENPNFTSLLKMEKELKTLALKYNFSLVPILAPKKKYYNNEIKPATYINFIIINDAVIVPTYQDKNDIVILPKDKK